MLMGNDVMILQEHDAMRIWELLRRIAATRGVAELVGREIVDELLAVQDELRRPWPRD